MKAQEAENHLRQHEHLKGTTFKIEDKTYLITNLYLKVFPQEECFAMVFMRNVNESTEEIEMKLSHLLA